MRWLLIAMLCLVVSGMLDDVRPRVVAGWIGLARCDRGRSPGRCRARCCAARSSWRWPALVAVALASLLGRLMPKERAPMNKLAELVARIPRLSAVRGRGR